MTATTATMDITNPVLRGMYPDPSWMWDEPGERVALVNSSFELVPGLPIHVSDDIANWELAGNAVDEAMAQRLLIPFVLDSGGLYAPTLRMIRGKYVIACTVARIDLDAAAAAGVDPESIEGPVQAKATSSSKPMRLRGHGAARTGSRAPRVSIQTSSRTLTAPCTGRRQGRPYARAGKGRPRCGPSGLTRRRGGCARRMTQTATMARRSSGRDMAWRRCGPKDRTCTASAIGCI